VDVEEDEDQAERGHLRMSEGAEKEEQSARREEPVSRESGALHGPQEQQRGRQSQRRGERIGHRRDPPHDLCAQRVQAPEAGAENAGDRGEPGAPRARCRRRRVGEGATEEGHQDDVQGMQEKHRQVERARRQTESVAEQCPDADADRGRQVGGGRFHQPGDPGRQVRTAAGERPQDPVVVPQEEVEAGDVRGRQGKPHDARREEEHEHHRVGRQVARSHRGSLPGRRRGGRRRRARRAPPRPRSLRARRTTRQGRLRSERDRGSTMRHACRVAAHVGCAPASPSKRSAFHSRTGSSSFAGTKPSATRAS